MKKKNLLRLPKQEDVTEIDMGNGDSLKVVELTDENRPAMVEIIASIYMDDECMYCHRNFTMEEVHKAIFGYPNPYGRIVHKECWDANNK